VNSHSLSKHPTDNRIYFLIHTILTSMKVDSVCETRLPTNKTAKSVDVEEVKILQFPE
jgi:hypothetical protein